MSDFFGLKKLYNNLFLIIFLTLIGIFVVLQLYVLTTVGPQGEHLTYLRNKEEEIKIATEVKTASILKLQSNQAVMEAIADRVQLEPKKVTMINPDQFNISAENVSP